MIQLLMLLAGLVTGAPGTSEDARSSRTRVRYSPFTLSCWTRLDTFEQNAYCKVEREPNDPVVRKLWEILSNAPETAERFDDQMVRVWIAEPGVNRSYYVDQRGRVRVALDKPARKLEKAALAALQSALGDLCPRFKRTRDASTVRGKAAPGKGKVSAVKE